MKKIAIFLCIILSLFCFTACRGERFALTADGEYTRISSIDGENKIFNFDTIQKLQIVQENEFTSAELTAQAGNVTAKETMLFQLDRSSSKVKSYASSKYLSGISLYSDVKYTYNFSELAFNGSYSKAGGYFATYDAYVNSMANPSDNYSGADYAYRNSIKLFDKDKLEKIEGNKDGGEFSVNATVKESEYKAFYDWYLSFFPYLRYKNYSHNPQNPTYEYFNPEKIHSATLFFKSSKVQLLSISIVIEIETVFGTEDIAVITAKTEFKKSGFSVTIPDPLPEKW